jgi:toxin-antitoxin system PIN domain toxin
VILVDANLLIYAVDRSAAQHPAARDWLQAKLTGHTRVGVPWASLLAFLRVVTNPRIVTGAVPMRDAWSAVRGWLELPPVWVPEPTPAHAEVLGSLLEGVSSAQLVPDAHLAALAIEHGLTICSNDSDFARFPDVRWENPIER